MKQPENLRLRLLDAFALESFSAFVVLSFSPGFGHGYPLIPYLIGDVATSLCLLPIIAALRRGDWMEKVAACALAVLPLAYIWLKVAIDLPKCLELLSSL